MKKQSFYKLAILMGAVVLMTACGRGNKSNDTTVVVKNGKNTVNVTVKDEENKEKESKEDKENKEEKDKDNQTSDKKEENTEKKDSEVKKEEKKETTDSSKSKEKKEEKKSENNKKESKVSKELKYTISKISDQRRSKNRNFYRVLDGDKESVIVSLGEKSTGGYSLDVVSLKLDSNKIIITIKENSPAENEEVTQAFTYPAVSVTFDKEQLKNKEIVVKEGNKLFETMDAEM